MSTLIAVTAAPGVSVAAPAAVEETVSATSLAETPQITAVRIGSCYLACGSPAVVYSGTPRLYATAVDPIGYPVTVTFEVRDATRTVTLATSGAMPASSKSTVSWQVSPATGGTLPDATYKWRARACSSTGCGNHSP